MTKVVIDIPEIEQKNIVIPKQNAIVYLPIIEIPERWAWGELKVGFKTYRFGLKIDKIQIVQQQVTANVIETEIELPKLKIPPFEVEV